MWAQAQLIQRFGRNRDPRLINRGIQIGLTTKTSRRSRGANEIQARLVTVQRVTGPVSPNQIEHAMLNQVPFGSASRIMRDRDNQTELIGQMLQANFPQPPPPASGTTAIGLDQQVGFSRIEQTPHFQPPSPDRRHRKLGGIMRDAHPNVALVVTNVIDAVGDDFALGRVQKVVHIHVAPLLPPFRPGLLKVADQLTLFGIDTDGWPMATLISLSPTAEGAKLLVTVGRLFAGQPFVIDPQRIILPLQQPTNRRQTDRILGCQGFLDFAQRLVRPLQSQHRVARRLFGQQSFQGDQQSGGFFSTKGRPPPLSCTRSVKSLAAISP